MLNRVVIAGRLVRDPDAKTVGENTVANMRIAVDRDYLNSSGNRDSDFFDVVAWRGTAEFVTKYFSKGRNIIIDGRLQSRNWEDKDGNKRTSIEIVADNVYFGDSKRDDSEGGHDAPTPPKQQAAVPAEDDGELPF